MNFVKESNGEGETNGLEREFIDDRRPLYERLKEQKDKKQFEYDEAHKLKNQYKGIDEEESLFLAQVARLKNDKELERIKEEEDIIRKANLYEKTCTASSSTTDLKIINVREQGNGKIYKKQPERHQQTSLKFGTLVRKRPIGMTESSMSDKRKKVPALTRICSYSDSDSEE